MERLALAVFDIKPLQFSLEKKKRKGGVEKKKKKKKESCAPLCENVRRGGKVSLPSSSFFSSEAISGFREKGDKCLSRNVGRLKLQYIYFFCNTPVSEA